MQTNGARRVGTHHGPEEAVRRSPSPRPNSAPRPKLSLEMRPTGDASSPSSLANGALRQKRRPPPLQRAKSDFGPHRGSRSGSDDETQEGDDEFKMRHGWESQFNSDEYLTFLTQNFYMYFTDKRHETGGIPKDPNASTRVHDWRMKDRLKTVSAALELCLNIGVDPPDVIKTNPCARLECWVDPTSPNAGPGHSPINQIGKNLQTQYEQLSMRTRYKVLADPTVDDTKKYCCTLRKSAKDERILFHYNGHGVPKPTPSGEIWVFNRNYTQYIPISLFDLQAWLGAPSLFVYDCSDAGLIIENFNKFVEKHELENADHRRKDPEAPSQNYADCIHLAACRRKETLPTNPDLPADVFTSCLTTPIEMAVRFFILQNRLPSAITLSDAQNIPGRVSERRTPIGELNWIFTAITDTIAWNTLSKPLFRKLFRQDLMVAALFRNFLLAQRVMRVYHCHPQCYPEIPSTHDHPLWQSWDLAVEMILQQLPDLIANEKREIEYEYKHSSFFSEQLTAFEVYLSQGAAEHKVPEQLPIVLQVLLSQVHRLRALVLLSKFLDLGPWAVNLALSIGIFPYVLKLLQSQAIELKPVMVFIWARILAVDQSCQLDLLKDNGYQYFISILSPHTALSVTNGEHRAMCAFIVAMFCKDYQQGQVVSSSPELVESLLFHMGDDENPLLRQWSCLCLSMLWVNFPEAKWVGIRALAHQRLCERAIDPVADVRAAMLHALTTFIGIPDLTDQVAQIEEFIASWLLIMAADGNTMVRRELLVFFSAFVNRYKARFLVAAYEQMVEEVEVFSRGKAKDYLDSSSDYNTRPYSRSLDGDAPVDLRPISQNSVYSAIWKQILNLSADPQPDIAQSGSIIVDNVIFALVDSPLGAQAEAIMEELQQSQSQPTTMQFSAVNGTASTYSQPNTRPSTPPSPLKQEGYWSSGLKRTASVAASLRNLAFGPTSTHSTPDKSQSLRGPLPDRTVAPRSRLPSEWSRPPDENDRHPVLSYQPAKFPSPSHFKPRDQTAHPEIPLKSTFYEWSVEYFREPQMKGSEADEPGSVDYNQRLWRRNRNDRIIAETQPLKEQAGTSRWNNSCGFFSNGTQPTKMYFHQFEDHLIVTDDRDSVCVWDWLHERRLNRFSNGNPKSSKITDVRLINEDDQALLMTGSSDGVIKVFRDYESQKKVELVSAFRALTDLVPSNRNAGLVFDWQQGRGSMLVAGDVKVIRIWNAGTEICTNDIPARSGSCVTSLTVDQLEGDVFIAGFGDGAVRVYDQRCRPAEAMVKVWKEHRQWVTNVHLQRGGVRELVSGCRSGEVKLWDIRNDKSIRTVKATSGTQRTLSVHEHAPVFATGSDHHTVNVYNTTSGEPLSTCQPHSSFLQQHRGAPIAATTFHPHRMMLACSAVNDSHVNLFRCNTKKDLSEETVVAI
ncbi:putative TORC1 growth control complex subunit Kog1 [Viridothelium virens]|uniref:Putative TORC1 growth control complex subunit Kog1 n=1 Tax=Viridothelium virens TaxID=1048519 RepID=A0A6A6GX33_VIRVR|nr:putative TORC1 growth control complex subunit Kog1 [Viridothelium virens]